MNLQCLIRIKRSSKYIIFTGLLLTLGACSETHDHALRLGTNIWLGYEPLYLARSLGELKPDRVKLVEYVSATQVMRGLIDGAIDAGALTLDEAILLQQQGLDIQLVLVMDYSAGADAIVARAGIKNLKGLKGKRVGVETTALGAYMMHRALEKGDLNLTELKIIPLEFSQHEQAYKTGKVDAVVTFDPVRSRLIASGANSLLDSSQLPGEVVDVLVVRTSVIKEQQSNIAMLLEAWFKTIDYIAANPVQAARAMTARLRLDEVGVLKAFKAVKLPDYKENRQLLALQTDTLATQAKRLSSVMLKNKLLSGPVQTADLFDSELLQQLYP